MSEIMDYDHPKWEEFCTRLEGPEGCNFTGEYFENGEVDPSTIKWKCKSGRDKSFATAILEQMGNIDIPASVEFFEQHGGYCDCEILFNVKRH